MFHKSLGLTGVALIVGLGFGLPAAAQDQPADFPQRPIDLIVMYPAGGAVDVTARTFAQVAEEELGISFRVENRVGGAGMVGHTYLAHDAAADGYTVGVIANPFMFTDILLRDGPFTADDFDPIVTVSFDPVVWVVNAESEIGDMGFDEIMDYAADHTLQVGMNPNSMFLFVSEFIERARGVTFDFIPFDGGRQGVIALLAGDVDATATFYTEIEQYIDNGDLVPIAVTGDSRHPMLPDTPTFSELGVAAGGQTWGATRFFALPVGVPEDRRAYLAQAFLNVLESDALAAAFDEAGLTLTPAGLEATQANYADTFQALQDSLEETGRL